jgi:hypothetical protein
MAKIYALARQVVDWLGKETDTPAKAFDLLKAMIAPYRGAGYQLDRPLNWQCRLCSGPHDPNTPKGRPHNPHTPEGREHWWDQWRQSFQDWNNQSALDALRKVFQRPW